jgi:hypothetical protein
MRHAFTVRWALCGLFVQLWVATVGKKKAPPAPKRQMLMSQPSSAFAAVDAILEVRVAETLDLLRVSNVCARHSTEVFDV